MPKFSNNLSTGVAVMAPETGFFFLAFFACATSKIFFSKTILQNSMKVKIFVPIKVSFNENNHIGFLVYCA